MILTSTQKTTLKTHMQANTNTTPATDANGNPLKTPFVVNTKLGTGDPDDHLAIAAWYNQNAKSGDNQPFSNRLLWHPTVTIAMLNTAIQWQTPPVGSDQPTITNSWMLWQSMTWNMAIDMTDTQVRKGVLQVWGDVAAPSTADSIGKVAQIVGANWILALSPAPVGAATNAWGAAHVAPLDAAGSKVFGGKLSQPDITDILLNG